MASLLTDYERKLASGHYKQVDEVRKKNSQIMPYGAVSNKRNNSEEQTMWITHE